MGFMAEQDDDTLELTEEAEGHEPEEIEDQEEQAGADEPEGEEESEVSFSDEASPASGERDTGLVKHLRSQLERVSKERDQLRSQVPAKPKIVVGERPALADCDYDEDKHAEALLAWSERKRQAEAEEADADRQARETQEAWSKEVEGYQAKKAALKFSDVQQAEDVVAATLSEIQRAVIIKSAENPALVEYALGKHPGKLAEISAITDPLKLAAAVARMEGKLTVTPRRRPPEPEQIARGTGSIIQGADKTLERLEKEAERTGDSSKLVAYRRQKRAQAK